LPAIRASSLAILVGKDWSDWFEEFEEKCISISSDIVCRKMGYVWNPKMNPKMLAFCEESQGFWKSLDLYKKIVKT
jgi:hypothetical protein